MASGEIDDPVPINTDFLRSAGRHFFQVVTHPLTNPSLFPDLHQFLLEIGPSLRELDSGTCFYFTSDPEWDSMNRTFIVRYDPETQDYSIQRVRPFSPNAPVTVLPKSEPSITSAWSDAKAAIKRKVEEFNPFPLLNNFQNSGE